MMWAMAEAEGIAGLDTSVAHPARVYDYWLGGTDNFAADREAAERVLAAAPGLRYRVRANRAFLGRATRYLAAEAGLRQFLDIGTGIPAAGNTHEVAQQVAPDARVVYVDNDRCKSSCAHTCRTSQGVWSGNAQPVPGRSHWADQASGVG